MADRSRFDGLLVIIVVLAVVFTALLAVRLTRGKLTRGGQRLLVVTMYLAGLALAGFATVSSARSTDGWGFVLALLPYVLIVQHAMYLQIVRQPVLTPLPADIRSPVKSVSGSDARRDDSDWWRMVLESARATTENYFSPVSLTLRYGTSAIVALVVALVAFLALFADPDILGRATPDSVQGAMIHAARLGVAGAYVYAMGYLGRRNFTHDVTSGGAMWCSISLAIGPVLASALAYLLNTGHGALAKPEDQPFGADLIYFAAGLSPRIITSFLERVVKKAWGESVASAATPRTLPVTQVSGVTPEVAERLAEEGILDLHGLAMADPLRLIRNTNFDRREIVSWIDEAILITTLPERWQALEKEGITGAVDLVSLVYPPPYREYKVEDELQAEVDRGAYLAVLCRRLKLSDQPDDDRETLKSIARRLVNDAQLRLIWVLHNHIADERMEQDILEQARRAAHA